MNFARSIFTVSSLTIVSRIAGFIRDALTAIFLGAGHEADAFFVAQRLPNLFRSLFAEGAFTAAFVPLYTSELKQGGLKAAQKFAGEALALLIAVLTPFSIVVLIFMPIAVLLIAPGFQSQPETYNLTVSFSRITFPYLLLISITALQSGVLNARGRFGPPAAAPIALNIVMIAGLLAIYAFDLPAGATLSWSLTISGGVQVLWLVVSCYRAGVSVPLFRPRLTPAGRRLFRQVGPGAVGAGAAQINLFLSTILASLLPTGSISYLFYADRLNQLPLGIIGIAVATTLLPLLSHHEAAGNVTAVRHYMNRAIEFSMVFGLPAAAGLVFASRPIIQTLFEHGAFSHADTIETANALSAYALGIPAFLLVKVFSARFFSTHDTKTPVKIAIVAMVTNVAGAALLLTVLDHVGIALATSIATWVNFGLLYYFLRRKGGFVFDSKLAYRLPRLVVCLMGMIVVTIALVFNMERLFVGGHTVNEITGLMLIIGLSGFVYFVLLQVTGAMRWREAIAILKRKGSE